MRISIVLTLTAWIFLSPCGAVYAEENDIGTSLIHPDQPFYFLKVIREDLELKLALTPRVKMFRQLEFATRRIRETRTLIPLNQDLIAQTLEKYNSHLGNMSDGTLEDQELATKIRESLVVHLNVLQKIYNQVSNKRAKVAIRASINRIIQRVDIPSFAKIPTCSFLAKEASSSGLNQTERAVLLERSQNCLKSLRSVSF